MAKKYSESFFTEPEARRPNELIIVHILDMQDKGTPKWHRKIERIRKVTWLGLYMIKTSQY